MRTLFPLFPVACLLLLTPPIATAQVISSTSTGNGSLHLIFRSDDGKLNHVFRDSSGTKWSDKYPVSPNQTASIAAFQAASCAGEGQNTLHVIGLTANGELVHTIRDNDWRQGLKITPGNETTFKSVCCFFGASKLQVLAVTTGGKIVHATREGETWRSFTLSPGFTANLANFRTVAGAVQANGTVHVIGTTDDGRIVHTFSPGGVWSKGLPISPGKMAGVGGFTSATCALTEVADLHVLGVTNDGRVVHSIRVANPEGWKSGYELTPSHTAGIANGFKAAQVSVGAGGRPHIIALANDGRLLHSMATKDGLWFAGYIISPRHTAWGGAFQALAAFVPDDRFLHVLALPTNGPSGPLHTTRETKSSSDKDEDGVWSDGWFMLPKTPAVQDSQNPGPLANPNELPIFAQSSVERMTLQVKVSRTGIVEIHKYASIKKQEGDWHHFYFFAILDEKRHTLFASDVSTLTIGAKTDTRFAHFGQPIDVDKDEIKTYDIGPDKAKNARSVVILMKQEKSGGTLLDKIKQFADDFKELSDAYDKMKNSTLGKDLQYLLFVLMAS